MLLGVDADAGCTGLLNGYLDADIDEIHVYGRALTGSEIQQVRNTPLESSPDITPAVFSSEQPVINRAQLCR
jgi:hypothetical protein